MAPPPQKPARAFPTLTLHCVLTAAVLCLGIYRFFIGDSNDPHRCGSLLTRGRWLDRRILQWQPDGCMLATYQPSDALECVENKHIVFIGDSIVRQTFYAFATAADPETDTDHPKHSDVELLPGYDGKKWKMTLSGRQADNSSAIDSDAPHGTPSSRISFHWDPFLNSTYTTSLIDHEIEKPALLVIGSGLWHLRYSATSGGVPAWRSAITPMIRAVADGSIADQTVILPVEIPVESRLDAERAATISAADVAEMNAYMKQELAALEPNPRLASIASVFNDVIADFSTATEDGLHYSPEITSLQARLLYNFKCNDARQTRAPFDKTCCARYPRPNWVQSAVLLALLVYAPIGLLTAARRTGVSRIFPEHKTLVAAAVFGCAVALLFVADRTYLFLKENKQYSALYFSVLCVVALAAGALTLTPAEKDLGFLNRDQTDEWKGWMQIAILIYHYLGASKISGIYNPIRILVAAYLYMTGYGHLTFFLKKADFGFRRVAGIVVRLNLLTAVLVYLMDTTYLSYYFSPLVTIWFGVIWVTMYIGHGYNHSTPFLLAKICIAAGAFAALIKYPGVLEALFSVANSVFRTQWNAREWRFRVALDMWVPWAGVLSALAYIKIQETGALVESVRWPQIKKMAIVLSALTMVLYFAFELTRPNKYVYNAYHPYISFLPILAFVVLRNATAYLRSTSSQLYMFFGKCSLETFIAQFHIFIAGDTRGIIMMIPGGDLLRPVNFVVTSLVFVFVSNQIATTSAALTTWICSTPAREPTPPPAPTVEYVPLSAVDPRPEEEKLMSPEETAGATHISIPEAPPVQVPPNRMAEFFVNDLRMRFVYILLGCWVLNVVYPSAG